MPAPRDRARFSIPPIVTDIDRAWALDQCPPWAVRGSAVEPLEEIVDDGGPLDAAPATPRPAARRLNWDWFVAVQIEHFERHFAGEVSSRRRWSGLWRGWWWPKANPRLYATKGSVPDVAHPFWRRGTAGFRLACRKATPTEAALFQRIGIAQLAPDDPRAAEVNQQLAGSGAARSAEPRPAEP